MVDSRFDAMMFSGRQRHLYIYMLVSDFLRAQLHYHLERRAPS